MYRNDGFYSETNHSVSTLTKMSVYYITRFWDQFALNWFAKEKKKLHYI